MPLRQTLEIHEVITAQAVDIQRAGLKRQVRDVANGARNVAMGLRRRMNALGNRDDEGTERVPGGVGRDVAAGTNTEVATGDDTEVDADGPNEIDYVEPNTEGEL